jgi:hypothetical protein
MRKEKLVVAYSRYHPDIFVEGLMKSMKTTQICHKPTEIQTKNLMRSSLEDYL